MPKRRPRRHRTKPPKGDRLYARLWEMVDGAVFDAFRTHPDYLTKKGASGHTARYSINKRVVGKLIDVLQQSKKSASPPKNSPKTVVGSEPKVRETIGSDCQAAL